MMDRSVQKGLFDELCESERESESESEREREGERERGKKFTSSAVLCGVYLAKNRVSRVQCDQIWRFIGLW